MTANMNNLSISLLGSFHATLNEELITQFRTKSVQALLIYLVCEGKRPSSREQLMELLWPGLPQASAQSNMRQTLYRLRKLIPEVAAKEGGVVPFIVSKNKTVQIHPDANYFADVQAFDLLVEQNPEQAIPLYRGDFLADFYLPESEQFEEWAAARRADYRRQVLSALEELTAAAIKQADYDKAEQSARQQLAIDNLQETAHRQLIETLARNGRRSDALSHYQSLCQLLETELDVQPETATEKLVEAIRNDLFSPDDGETAVLSLNTQPASPSKQKSLSHLPVQTTPFIGRQAELAALNDLLAQPQTRLITILGPGGMGKTRLATAVAEQQLAQEQYPDGIFFVPLAGLHESDRIAAVIGEVLQLRLEYGETQLLTYLENKHLLLVLDNFEHLLDGSDLVRRLLNAAPHLQILTTSRERLRLQGEQLFPIQGLAMDEDAQGLFVQAARRIQPDFQVTDEIIPTLNHICRLVEGMPLALVLAAAWLDMLTLPEIAAEIQHNLDFLETDLRDVPHRHRSMRAVFDTSWQQLADNEQCLLAQVSIFRGGFTREAAMTITQASLRDLARLVHKSLLSFDGENGRYHIHELLRQYSATHLQTDSDLTNRFNNYYCHWLITQKDALHGPQQAETIQQIEADMDNIRKAITGYVSQNQFSDLQPALATLNSFYIVRGKLHEAITLFKELAHRLEAHPDWAPHTHVWLLIWLSSLNGMIFEQVESDGCLRQAKKVLQNPIFQNRDIQMEKAAISVQEGYSIFHFEPEKAVQLFRESVVLAEAVGDCILLCHSLLGLGRGLRQINDFAAAQQAFSRSLSIAQKLGDPVLQLEPQLLLDFQNMLAGHIEEAEEAFAHAIAEIRVFNHPERLRMGLHYLAFAQMMNGRFAASIATNKKRRQVEIESGSYNALLPQGEIGDALLNLHLGQYEATAKIEQILAQATVDQYFISDAFVIAGLLAIARGDLATAKEQFQLSQAHYMSPWICVWIHRVESGLALLAAMSGELATAEKLIHTELQLYIEGYKQKLNGFVPISFVLALSSYLMAIKEEPERAIELYALAQQNSFMANSRWVADVIGNQITAVSAKLPSQKVAAAQARGQELDVMETAVSILQTKDS